MSHDMHPDLFGGETPISKPPHGPYEKRKKQLQYREAEAGSEKRCENCAHLIKKNFHGRNYYKCELIGMSSSEATDIRLKNTCNRFKKAENG